jgi:hypothetical protein
MKAMCVLGLCVAGTAVVLVLSMSHASAQAVPEAYYAGEITGCGEPLCGSLDFRVSEDGSEVQRFKVYNVPGDVCEFDSYLYPLSLPIGEDNTFGPGIPGFFEVSGSFSSEDDAVGTLRLVTYNPDCDTDVLDWTADVSAPPVGGIAELPEVADSSAGDYVGLAGLAAVALAAVPAGAWWARRRWLS